MQLRERCSSEFSQGKGKDEGEKEVTWTPTPLEHDPDEAALDAIVKESRDLEEEDGSKESSSEGSTFEKEDEETKMEDTP